MVAVSRGGKKQKRLPLPARRGIPFERVMVGLVTLFVFALPLFIWPTSTEYGYSKSILALIGISVLFALWAAWSLFKKEWRMRVPWIGVPVLGFVAASLLSLVNAANGRMVIQSVTLVLFFFLFYLIVVQFVKEKRDVNLILYSLLVSSFLCSLYGLLQYLGVVRGAFGQSGLPEIISTMGNKNYLGEFLVSLLFPAVILVVRLKSRLLRVAAIALVAFDFGTVLLVQQASAVFALIAASFAFLVAFVIFRPVEPVKRNRIWLLALVATLAVTFVVESPSGPLNSVAGLSAEMPWFLEKLVSEGSAKTRTWDWWIGWEMLRDHPVAGVGLGNYKVDFLPYKAKFLTTPRGAGYDFYIPRAAQAHNEYIQVASELGAFGIAALVTFLVVIPVTFWRRLRRSRDESDRLDLILLGCGVVSFLVVALAGFPGHLPAASLVVVLTLGLASSRAYGQGAEFEVSLKGRLLVGAVAATFVLGLIVSILAARDFSGDVLLGRGKSELQRGESRLAERDLRKSVALDFSPSEAFYQLGILEAKEGRYQEAKADLEKCLTRFATENVYLNLATVAYNLKDTAGARRNLDLLSATRPYPELEIEAQYLRALLSTQEGDYDRASSEFEALIQAHPDFERAFITLGDLERARGLGAEARKHYGEALALIRDKLATARAKLAPGVTLRVEEYTAARDAVDLLTREKEAAETGLAKVTSP